MSFGRKRTTTRGVSQDLGTVYVVRASCGPTLLGASIRAATSMPLLCALTSQKGIDRERTEAIQQKEAYYTRWQGHGIELPERIGGIRNFLTPTELTKEEEYVLDPKVRSVYLKLGWNKGAIVDGSALLFADRSHAVDTIWFKKPQSSSGNVIHTRDDLNGDENHNGVSIRVQLDRIPLHVHHILITSSVYDCVTSFSDLDGFHLKMVHGERRCHHREMFVFNPTSMTGEHMILGDLMRKGGYWSFKAMGDSATGRCISHFLKNPANMTCLARCHSYAPVFRSITVYVLKATNLTPADSSGRFRKTLRLPDPYYQIQYKRKPFASNYVTGTLNPVWKRVPFDLGPVTDTEQKALKITVFSYDPVSFDGFLGTLRIPARALFNAGLGDHELSFPLGPAKIRGVHNDDVSGVIYLKIIVT